ncbi:MAG: ABC transporter permease [Acidimicrobiia bacterium]|jgi:cell division transport system permease protein|nr:ABC transporter permease [Acidimicrobiia bacterium]MBJ7381329.1 ABC transporter permease [Acidimicrobiia bacterium]MBJ7513470.1 ABC transporter permease [Acidimicrobiia bacterium]
MITRLSYFARETLVSLKRNLLMTIAGVITVTVSLCVLGGAWMLNTLVNHGTERWKNGVELEVFMNVDATDAQIAAVQRQLVNDPEVRDFRYLTKDDALTEFRRLFKDQPDLVNSVDAAALPSSFRVAPIKAELTKTVADRFQSQPGVDEVKTAEKQVRQLLSATAWIRTAFIVIFALLLFASLFLIVNTIRLATFARRREIEVMKLVGASNWFVRIPFMLEGFVQGVVGALVAFMAMLGLQNVLTNAISRNSDFSRGFYVTTGDAITIGLMLVAIGAGIGVLGAIIGLRRFIEA